MAIRTLYGICKRGQFVLIIILFEIFFHSCHGLSSTIQSRLSDNVLFRETLLMPSSDIEREAKELYDKALLEFGPIGKTLKEICGPWIEIGCSCTGTSDEVILQCKELDLQDVPSDLPKELYKLNKGEITAETLKSVTLFILAGPQEKFNEVEFEVLKEFISSGGSLFVLLGENGETDFDTNINFLLEEFGMNINSDSVVRPHYYKYFHPKEVLINGGIVCDNMVKALESSKKNPNNILEEKYGLEFVYPFGATLNVVSPSNVLMTTSTVAYPFNRPLCGHYCNDKNGQILAVGSGHMFQDKYISNEFNMNIWDYFITLLVDKNIKFKSSDFNDVEIQDYTSVPDIIYLAEQPKICLMESFDYDIPADFKKLFDMTLYSINNDKLVEVIETYEKLSVEYEPLKIIKPQFEIPLPPTQLAVFPPIFSELSSPPVELFDLDEAFSSEKTQITQLTNKCYQSDGKSSRSIDEKELEYFIQECGRILNITHDDQKVSGKEILYSVSLKIANYKKLDRE